MIREKGRYRRLAHCLFWDRAHNHSNFELTRPSASTQFPRLSLSLSSSSSARWLPALVSKTLTQLQSLKPLLLWRNQCPMDSILASTLEEVCIRGSAGIPLTDLWPALQASLSSAGLPLCDAVKTALWSRLLFHPALRFEASDGSFLVPSDNFLRSFDEAERLGLKIVAEEHLKENFLGIYDLKAADGELSAEKKRVLERLALARLVCDVISIVQWGNSVVCWSFIMLVDSHWCVY